MADEKRDLLARHLREIKAKSKSKSFSDLVMRMRAEQEFRSILDDLKEEIHSQEILPFLMPEREKIEYPPDFIVWKDEIRIPLFLVETAHKDKCSILRSKIVNFLDYLKRTDLTEAVIVWMLPPDFPSISLKIEEIEEKAKSGEESFIIEPVRPFKEVIMGSMRKKTTVWPVPKYEEIPQIKEPEILLETFESAFSRIFEKELKRRRPRLSYKKEALKDITDEELEEIWLIIENYIKGELTLEDFVRSFRLLAKSRQKSSLGE